MGRASTVAALLILLAALCAAQDSSVRELGDGFQMKSRTLDSGLVLILIHFPAKYLKGPDEFNKGTRIALEKVLGCKELRCPVQIKRQGRGFIVQMRNGQLLSVEMMHQSDADPSPAGIEFLQAEPSPPGGNQRRQIGKAEFQT